MRQSAASKRKKNTFSFCIIDRSLTHLSGINSLCQVWVPCTCYIAHEPRFLLRSYLRVCFSWFSSRFAFSSCLFLFASLSLFPLHLDRRVGSTLLDFPFFSCWHVQLDRRKTPPVSSTSSLLTEKQTSRKNEIRFGRSALKKREKKRKRRRRRGEEGWRRRKEKKGLVFFFHLCFPFSCLSMCPGSLVSPPCGSCGTRAE